MGMFDHILSKVHLPVAGMEDRLFQTKDTPNQMMDNFQIREDGSLWVQEYDIEDHSDPNAEGIRALAGALTRVNERWVPCNDFTGEIRFYDSYAIAPRRGWVEFSAYFVNGNLAHEIVVVELDNPDAENPNEA